MSNFIDLIGKVFGNLLVIERLDKNSSGRYNWLCKCSCKNATEIIVDGSRLKTGQAISCGCIKRPKITDESDLTGMKFGRWNVVERGKDKGKQAMWKCFCDCNPNKIIDIAGCTLKSGMSTSCGCYHKEKVRLDYGESAFNRVFRSYKKHAEKLGLPFSLDRNEVKTITQCDCYYCGKIPLQMVNDGGYGEYTYNGIDRLDSSVGYVKDNVVPCCIQCNRAKNITSEKDFYEWINNVYNHCVKYKIKEILSQ